MKIALCGYVFEINNRHDYLEKLCKDYLTDKGADVVISCTDEDVLYEREQTLPETYSSDAPYESLAVYRKICNFLANKGAFLMHSAVIEVDGKAIAFLAHSGVGKSTHLVNWKKEFDSEVKIVNGDKPLVLKKDGVFYACGTPWAGKEGWQRNVVVPLYALCFLSRDKDNSCVEISSEKVGFRLVEQVYMPPTEKEADAVLTLLDDMLKTVKKFDLRVNKEQNSALIAKNAILGE